MSLSNPEYSQSSILRPIEIRPDHKQIKGSLPALTLTAIGVVFGDIGTSPLYALKACFNPEHGIPFSQEAVFGVISMVFWAFIIVVSLKYVLFVMRANNHGEGGILALMAMALRTAPGGSKRALSIMMLGVFGACMFYGDAIITPAISVLSAVEGMEIVSTDFKEYVLPLTILILLTLFIIQKNGSTVIGFLFGPIMVIWFLVLGIMGVYNIIDNSSILAAVNPMFAIDFLIEHTLQGLIIMGAVSLVLTGTEALYADMGHFGIRPIQCAWFFIAMPCLLMNYFGQGAMLLNRPDSITNPFFLMVPETFTVGLVLLATIATVIASQAVISGTYSMTSQAILLGFVPRMKVTHTSDKRIGQIYVPFINWMLLILIIAVVLIFQQSSDLAAAYGIAVTTTMLITTCLAAVVMKVVWKWNPLIVTLIITAFLTIDSAFFAANLLKIMQGGWLSLTIGAICFVLLMTWYQGRKLLRDKAIKSGIQLESFMSALLQNEPVRVDGNAVFLTAHVDYVPVAMLHNLKHNQVLHKRVIFLKVSIWDVPRIKKEDRLNLKDMGDGIYLVRAIYGFKETPNIKGILKLLESEHKIYCDLLETSFFLSKDTIIPSSIRGMAPWRETLFTWMYQNASQSSDFFQIPANRVVELGTKIEI
ncbi:MAG: potassium transporter Kup [Nitrosospira sp.]|nr:potassium transporter Kup [Nitrosospira sp.]